jgi:hypothetical protein
MKVFIFLILIIGQGWLMQAKAQKKKKPDSTNVTIRFDNSINNHAPVDSILVIFDRYNLTEAGAIKQVFYPVNNKVVIKDVPEGKFFINVICLGIYKDNFSEISYVYEKRKNKNTFSFRLQPSEVYNDTSIYIPKETIDPAKFLILRQKAQR